jgi:hypothetical protein
LAAIRRAGAGRAMAISPHPFITGLSNRIGAIDRALSYVSGFPNV